MSERIVLYVEDDDAAYALFRMVARERYTGLEVHHVWDGEQALTFLARSGSYRDAPRPDLILLDLSLPKRHGFEVLRAIKADESLRSIPVVIFSSSCSASDKLQSMALGAHRFVTKPATLDLFTAALESAFRQE